MAWHRLEHARSRVNELERIKTKHLGSRPASRNIPTATGGGSTVTTTAATTMPPTAGTPTTPSTPVTMSLMGHQQQQMSGTGMVNNG
jgi:hypothetical protein